MDEYIERELAIEALSRGEGCGNVCRRAIERIPSADVAPVVHGRWNVVEGLMLDNAICSNCGRRFQAYYEEYHFCPNCGAKMDGGADNATN